MQKNEETIPYLIPANVLKDSKLVPKRFMAAKTYDELEEAIEYYTALMEAYDKQYTTEENQCNTSYVTHSDNLHKLTGKLEKAITQLEKTERTSTAKENGDPFADYDEDIADTLRRLSVLVEKNNLHLIESENKFYFKTGSRYIGATASTLSTTKGILCSDKYKAPIVDYLQSNGRVKSHIVSTFDKVGEHEFNIVEDQGVLEPQEGKCNPLIDILFTSLADGDAEREQVFKRWILHKLYKPEDYKLMGVFFYGAGRAGRNELFEKLLPMFTNGVGVTITNPHTLFEAPFNAELSGKRFVMCDEFALTNKKTNNKMKALIGNKWFQLNIKYGFQGSVANTAGYVFVCNDNSPLRLLGGDASDDRYLLMPLTRNIILHTMTHLGYDSEHLKGKDLAIQKKDANYIKAEAWYNKNMGCLTDPVETAKCLGTMIQDNAELFEDGEYIGVRPRPVFKEDYKTAVINNRGTVETFCETLFNHTYFRMGRFKEIYKFYCGWVEATGGSWEKMHLISQKDFKFKVDNYIRLNNAPVKALSGSNHKKYNMSKGTRISFTGYVKDDITKPNWYFENQYMPEQVNMASFDHLGMYSIDDWFNNDELMTKDVYDESGNARDNPELDFDNVLDEARKRAGVSLRTMAKHLVSIKYI